MELRNNDYAFITEEEFLKLPKTIKVEYCNGRLIYMQAASPKHDEISYNLKLQTKNFFKNTKCNVYGPEVGLKVITNRRNRIVLPDIFVTCDDNFVKDTYHGIPLIIIEVLSPYTAENDFGNKLDDYQYIGVMEYLIVSQSENYVRQYKLIDKKYELVKEYQADEEYQSVVFKDLHFQLSEIFNLNIGNNMPELF